MLHSTRRRVYNTYGKYHDTIDAKWLVFMWSEKDHINGSSHVYNIPGFLLWILLCKPWIQSNCFRSADRYLERGPHGPRQDFAVLAPVPQEYEGRWKPKGCDFVVLGLCEDYAKGLLSITFHSSKVMISVTAGSVRTPHYWMRVNRNLPTRCQKTSLRAFISWIAMATYVGKWSLTSRMLRAYSIGASIAAGQIYPAKRIVALFSSGEGPLTFCLDFPLPPEVRPSLQSWLARQQHFQVLEKLCPHLRTLSCYPIHAVYWCMSTLFLFF